MEKRTRIPAEVRKAALEKATRVEKLWIMARDVARWRSPKRAKLLVETNLKDMIADPTYLQLTPEDVELCKTELIRVQGMSPEEFYEELKIKP